MIILDTNVVSELMRARPHEAVITWVARQSMQDLFTTSITKGEILYGVALLPEGRRRRELAMGAERMFRNYFPERVLAFDAGASVYYAAILSRRRLQGSPVEPLDAQIAAIAANHAALVATRNIGDFEGSGVPLIDPWMAD